MSCVYCYVTVEYVCISRILLVINVCNKENTLCSPCRTESFSSFIDPLTLSFAREYFKLSNFTVFFDYVLHIHIYMLRNFASPVTLFIVVIN